MSRALYFRSAIRIITAYHRNKVDNSFFSLLSPTHLRVYQALNVPSAIRRFCFHGTFKRLGGILTIWESPCLFPNAQMESTFGKSSCLLKKKGQMDLDDHHASCPSYQDLVSIFRPVPFWAGAFYANGCEGRQWAPLRAVRAHSYAVSGEVPRLAVSLLLISLGCALGRFIAHVKCRRWAWASRGNPS